MLTLWHVTFLSPACTVAHLVLKTAMEKVTIIMSPENGDSH